MDNSKEKLKLISTGGLGDSYIVSLKVAALKKQGVCVDWLHVESCDLSSQFSELFPDSKFEHHPDYINLYSRGTWSDRIPISSGIDNFCPLKGKTNFSLKDDDAFDISCSNTSLYDIVLQCSAGMNSGRNWLVDPRNIKKILQNMGYNTILIGNDSRFFDEKDESNKVLKYSLKQSLSFILNCKLFIGLSGFLNYYACANKVNNIHLIETEHHEKIYYHPLWKKYTKTIKYPSINEIIPNIFGVEKVSK